MRNTPKVNARLSLVLGAVAMFLAVAPGAFGAHALKARLSPEMANVWQTAVTYHAWHGLALPATGLVMLHRPEGAGVWASPAGCSSPRSCSSPAASK